MSEPFTATHVIQTGTGRTYVHAVSMEDVSGRANDRQRLVLYTEAEWQTCDNADWTYDPDDGLAFQGSAFAPICNGAELQTFAQCAWTTSDGWREDGTRETMSVASRIQIGMRVESGEGEDHDVGRVRTISEDGKTAFVDWESGVSTPADVAALREVSS